MRRDLDALPEQMPAREYFLIVDMSGSMVGFPLDTAKELMIRLLRNLKSMDRFNILFFAGGSAVLPPQPLAATPENIALAQAMLRSVSARRNCAGRSERLSIGRCCQCR
jgi:Ca-activated chloride channel family protein